MYRDEDIWLRSSKPGLRELKHRFSPLSHQGGSNSSSNGDSANSSAATEEPAAKRAKLESPPDSSSASSSTSSSPASVAPPPNLPSLKPGRDTADVIDEGFIDDVPATHVVSPWEIEDLPPEGAALGPTFKPSRSKQRGSGGSASSGANSSRRRAAAAAASGDVFSFADDGGLMDARSDKLSPHGSLPVGCVLLFGLTEWLSVGAQSWRC